MTMERYQDPRCQTSFVQRETHNSWLLVFLSLFCFLPKQWCFVNSNILRVSRHNRKRIGTPSKKWILKSLFIRVIEICIRTRIKGSFPSTLHPWISPRLSPIFQRASLLRMLPSGVYLELGGQLSPGAWRGPASGWGFRHAPLVRENKTSQPRLLIHYCSSLATHA